MTRTTTEEMSVLGPAWAAEATELEDIDLPAGAVAVLEWCDGEGLNLTDWLEVTFYLAEGWPSSPDWSLPADAPESQLLKWTRDQLRGPDELEADHGMWFERRSIVLTVGTGVPKRHALLIAHPGA